MQQNAFIIHGFSGHPRENWIPWLSGELQKLGLEVIVPTFPTPDNQTLDTWLATFEGYRLKMNESSLFIGHSLGCSFVLNLLERSDIPIKATFLVAGFVGYLNIESIDPLITTFVERHFDWPKIRRNGRQFYIFQSDNDPYVPTGKGEYLARELDGELIMVSGAGHFNINAGYGQFELLLEKVKQEISPQENASAR